MKTPRSIAALALVALLAAGCADRGPKETAGGLLGGAGGAVAGAQFGSGTGRLAAVAAGTILGALIGSEVGKSLDRADRAYLHETTVHALEYSPSGYTNTWRNPDSGHYGYVAAQPAYRTGAGAYCREYQQSVVVGGRVEEAYGTACRQPDGSWAVVR
jgi:surface antigen